MVDRTIARRDSVAIRNAVEAILARHGWHPKAAIRDAEKFGNECEATLIANRHGHPAVEVKR